jgi:hypothetical protein
MSPHRVGCTAFRETNKYQRMNNHDSPIVFGDSAREGAAPAEPTLWTAPAVAEGVLYVATSPTGTATSMGERFDLEALIRTPPEKLVVSLCQHLH